jgi:hypothetical protein
MICDWDANVPDSTGEASPLFNGWFAAISFWRAAVFELRFANKGKPAPHFALTFVHRRSRNPENQRWHGPCNTDFAAKVKIITECNHVPGWTFIGRLIKV